MRKSPIDIISAVLTGDFKSAASPEVLVERINLKNGNEESSDQVV